LDNSLKPHPLVDGSHLNPMLLCLEQSSNVIAHAP
jgi:hypothetical protein